MALQYRRHHIALGHVQGVGSLEVDVCAGEHVRHLAPTHPATHVSGDDGDGRECLVDLYQPAGIGAVVAERKGHVGPGVQNKDESAAGDGLVDGPHALFIQGEVLVLLVQLEAQEPALGDPEHLGAWALGARALGMNAAKWHDPVAADAE